MLATRTQKIRLAVIASLLVFALALIVVNIYYSNRTDAGLPAPPPAVPPATSREPRMKADDVLAKLKPGMLRVDVESILGPPTAVDSIVSGTGRLSYRATFNRDRLRPPLPPLVLEFDATQPGHPLLVVKTM
jgi:hypothetical protein